MTMALRSQDMLGEKLENAQKKLERITHRWWFF
jgi:hypothetical protein